MSCASSRGTHESTGCSGISCTSSRNCSRRTAMGASRPSSRSKLASSRRCRSCMWQPVLSPLWKSSTPQRQAYQSTLCQASASLSDRKSTRLNSSHLVISYAVFCLKKKNLHAELAAVDRDAPGRPPEADLGGQSQRAPRLACSLPPGCQTSAHSSLCESTDLSLSSL